LAWRTPIEPEPLPHEWVLRQLADADLEDDDAVARLLEGRGVISWPYFDSALVPPDRRGLLAPAPSVDERRRLRWWEQRGDATLEDARWWLKTARALGRTWSYVQLNKDPASAWDAEGFVELNEDDLWTEFTLALDVGLRPFRARAEFRRDFMGQHQHTFGVPRVGLYSAACRQVFNLIVNDETARICENQTCGRIFVHQLGGAVQGKYRSKGLRFCTPACANAETQRQHRRRKAAAKKSSQEEQA